MVKPLAKQRLQSVRDRMQARQLDALIVYSQRRGHIPYLSGYRPNYHTNSAFLVLPLEGEPAMLIKFGFDMPRARSQSWIDDIRPGHSEDACFLFREFAGILEEKGLRGARLGWVAADDTIDEMSAGLWECMRRELPAARLEPASDLVNRLRLSKDPGEVELLRRATEIIECSAQALGRALAPGVEDCAAAAQAATAGLSAGASRCDVILSPRAAELTLPPKHDRFRQGDAVSLELTVEYEGYWVQICRTFSLGPASPLQKRVFAACRDAYQAAVDLARPGARAADLARAAISVVDQA
ncbi:MAG: aminopeptidase P family protein, partial [Acidobacteria bacterium]|nr:aminopeptidase P family protein [Acidobacteriota bacterium]